MFLWCSDIYFVIKTLGTLLDMFLWRFMPPWRSGLDGPYM